MFASFTKIDDGNSCKILLLSPREVSVRQPLGAGCPQSLTDLRVLIVVAEQVLTEILDFLGRPDLYSDLHLQTGRVWSYVPRTHRWVHSLQGDWGRKSWWWDNQRRWQTLQRGIIQDPVGKERAISWLCSAQEHAVECISIKEASFCLVFSDDRAWQICVVHSSRLAST